MKRWIIGALAFLVPLTSQAADVKFSALASLTQENLAAADIFVVVDDDASVGKSVTAAEMDERYRYNIQTPGAIGASEIDWATNQYHTKTLSANTTFTFSNVPTNGGQGIVVRLQNGASYTVNWPAAVKWEGGTAPTMTTGAGAVDTCTFVAWSSSDIHGSCLQDLQ